MRQQRGVRIAGERPLTQAQELVLARARVHVAGDGCRWHNRQVSAPPIDAWLASARATWPDVQVAEPAFRAAIDARLALGIAPAELAATDVYLAVACAHGDPAAVAHFEREHVARIASWLGRHERDQLVIDEVRQRVRARALAARDGAPPRIADFSGRGPLGAWVRVIALREHASLCRASVDASDDELADLARTGELTPELACLRARILPVVTAAFRAAVAALPARARTLMRLCYVDGTSLDAIGRMYGVNKSTVSRWLASARADVLAGARDRVRAELTLPATDIDSLLGAMPRDLELSLHGLL